MSIIARQTEILFVAVWFAFAITLLITNLRKSQASFEHIPDFCLWKGVVLLCTGFVGGLLTAWTGSGVDIWSFSILTLLFRVSEKVATPTSVILMSLNSWVGFYWRALIQQNISQLAWEYFAVSFPVDVIFAPLGSFLSSHMHAQVLACAIYVLETLAFFEFVVTRFELWAILPALGILTLA